MEEVKLDDVVYDPWRGFRRENFSFFEEGVYFCKDSSSEVKFTAKVSPPSPILLYDPPVGENLTIPDPGMFLGCASDNAEDVVEFKYEGDAATKLNVEWLRFSPSGKYALIYRVDKQDKIFKGKVSCLKNKGAVMEWNFEMMKAPEIFFDNYLSEIHCLMDFEEEDGVEVEAKSLRCSNGIECSYYERCLEEGNVCDHLGQVVYFNKRRTQCAPLADKIVKSCVNHYYTSWNGVAQCKGNGFKRNWQYFTALNLHKYTDWTKVYETDLLRLERDEGKPNGFRCTGVGFLFANSLGFELEYRNYSTEFIQGEGTGGKVTIHEHPSPYKIQGFQVVSSLELINCSNVAYVRCVAPFWNSTGVIKTRFYKL